MKRYRFAAEIVSTSPPPVVPSIVAKSIAEQLGIEVSVASSEEIDSHDALVVEIAKVMATAIAAVADDHLPFPTRSAGLCELKPTTTTTAATTASSSSSSITGGGGNAGGGGGRPIAATTYDRASLSTLARIVNPHCAKWKTRSLVAAARHVAVFDVLARLVAAAPDVFLTDTPTGTTTTEAYASVVGYCEPIIEAYITTTPEDSIDGIRAARHAFNALLMEKTTALTPDSVASYDVTMLYTACASLDVRVNMTSTIDDMRHGLGIALMAAYLPSRVRSLEVLEAHGHGRSATCTCAAISPAIVSIQVSRSIEPVAAMIASGSPLASGMLRFIHPETPGDAIALVAGLFRCDITLAPCPISEYYKAAADATRGAPWVPLADPSSEFARLFRMAPTYVDIDVTWNPAFRRMYSPVDLVVMATSEGFERRTLDCSGIEVFLSDESPETAAALPIPFVRNREDTGSARCVFSSAELALNYARNSGTVIIGLANAENGDSPVSLDELTSEAENDPATVLTFECRIGATGENHRVGILVADFIELVRLYNAFVIPVGDTIVHFLSKRIVARLRAISGFTNPPLTDAINAVDASTARLKTIADELARQPLDVRTEAADAASRLRDAAMYMRGWKVSEATSVPPHPYPLMSIDTTFPQDKQGEIDCNVTAALLHLDAALATPGGIVVSGMPLLSPSASSKTGMVSFLPTLSADQGFVVSDRLTIVRDGDAQGNPYSCMRMSSNLFATTAFFILSALGMDPGFSIRDLSIIA